MKREQNTPTRYISFSTRETRIYICVRCGTTEKATPGAMAFSVCDISRGPIRSHARAQVNLYLSIYTFTYTEQCAMSSKRYGRHGQIQWKERPEPSGNIFCLI